MLLARPTVVLLLVLTIRTVFSSQRLATLAAWPQPPGEQRASRSMTSGASTPPSSVHSTTSPVPVSDGSVPQPICGWRASPSSSSSPLPGRLRRFPCAAPGRRRALRRARGQARVPGQGGRARLACALTLCASDSVGRCQLQRCELPILMLMLALPTIGLLALRCLEDKASV